MLNFNKQTETKKSTWNEGTSMTSACVLFCRIRSETHCVQHIILFRSQRLMRAQLDEMNSHTHYNKKGRSTGAKMRQSKAGSAILMTLHCSKSAQDNNMVPLEREPKISIRYLPISHVLFPASHFLFALFYCVKTWVFFQWLVVVGVVWMGGWNIQKPVSHFRSAHNT